MIHAPSVFRRCLPWLVLAGLLTAPVARCETVQATVVEVVRGDIVVVEDALKARHTVRLAGTDAPDL